MSKAVTSEYNNRHEAWKTNRSCVGDDEEKENCDKIIEGSRPRSSILRMAPSSTNPDLSKVNEVNEVEDTPEINITTNRSASFMSPTSPASTHVSSVDDNQYFFLRNPRPCCTRWLAYLWTSLRSFLFVFASPALWLKKLVRMNLLPVLLVLFIVYFVLILGFAFFVFLLGDLSTRRYNEEDDKYIEPKCLGGAAEEYPGWYTWMDVITLSWTTFSTVGYGNIYPVSISVKDTNDPICILITIILSFEAFLGIIYASLAAGVIVGVLSQQASKADIRFSSVVVIREKRANLSISDPNGDDPNNEIEDDHSSISSSSSIGNESYIQSIAEIPGDDHNSVDLETGLAPPPHPLHPHRESQLYHVSSYRTLPPPVLEFRIANERWRSNTWKNVKRRWFSRNKKRTSATRKSVMSSSTPTPLTTSESYNPNGALINTMLNVSVGFQERVYLSHSSTLRFEPLTLVMDSHPFFEQVWYARHPLDEHSPLLTRKTRRVIKLNNGRWPRHLFDDGGTTITSNLMTLDDNPDIAVRTATTIRSPPSPSRSKSEASQNDDLPTPHRLEKHLRGGMHGKERSDGADNAT